MTARTIPFLQPTVLLSLALMGIVVMMILPVPAWVLDVGLAVSFALAILIFTTTLFIEHPLQFSAFPTVLLAALMLRLSLNISSTKLIIGEGHTGTGAAGDVIEGFASFIMGGSVLLGLVIFGVLLIVNFIVITKGASRMAEVGARFALDGMPGKQLAIDADMNAGAIDHAEAKRRRERDQQETTFFGSLDGASKFVKGDAVAGLLITLLNLVVGLVAGAMVHGMPLGAAFETYAILTVGDGLVTQIPAVVISIASGLLLARGGDDGPTDLALFDQLGGRSAALGTVAFLMALFALVPGLPFLPFMAGAVALGLLAARAAQRARAAAPDGPSEAEPARPARTMGDVLDLDDIHIEFAPDLVSMVLDPSTGLDGRIATMRNHVASSYGLILPEIRLTDDPSLKPGTYVIRIHGVERARDSLAPGQVLAVGVADPAALPPGRDVEEPVYRAPARWIDPARQDEAALGGATTVVPAEVLATHLLETVKRDFPRLMTLKALRRLIDAFTQPSDPARAEANRRLVDELIPDRVPKELLLQVLQLLLEERVSIRNLPLILETIAHTRGATASPEAICEAVRRRLGLQLVMPLVREDGTLPLIQLDPEWEAAFQAHEMAGDRGDPVVALPPDAFNRLAEAAASAVGETAARGIDAALVTSSPRRRFLSLVLSTRNLPTPVLSFEEIDRSIRPALVGTVAA
ncbi:flagellar biosynthesis protein FlhA [Palleronia sediminis]|uniref:Flagellar biosynthesis protein FlhA n=1 Tax=Palleronia sediminis TaxID=2547833 RepID=A0A4R5ZVC6_9RHOB|nr:flagellar biosynthesis protein FlhA [Palleronia sediminis]TDL74204.1 flagellar biosynthesis protein FlhA [Palleronia sediminis]